MYRGNPIKRPARASNQEAESWPAFTDLLGAFVLVIFFGLLFFVINFRKAESKVSAYNNQLKRKEKKLLTYGKALKQQEKQLRNMKTEILEQRQKLRAERESNRRLLRDLRTTESRLRKTIGAKKSLEKMFNRLKEERLKIEKARQKAEMALAKAQAALTKAELAKARCQTQVESYVGVRKRIIDRIFRGLRKSVKVPNLLQFDTKGGSIVLGAKVLFRAGSAHMPAKGKENLKLVWEQIHRVLKHPLNRPYIAGIVVEGYTSSEGNKRSNWQLSAKRALQALRYLQPHGGKYWSNRGLIAAAGYGPTRVKRNNEGQENKATSRRIEFRILFRDREQLESLMKQFKQGKE
jgi:outer membrane protein OmpA-like peptidoglycan-associated protein